MKKALLLLLVALVFSNEGHGFLLHRPPRIVLQPLHTTSSSMNKNKNNNNEKLYRELSLFMNINTTITNTSNQSIPQHYNMPQIQQTCYDEK